MNGYSSSSSKTGTVFLVVMSLIGLLTLAPSPALAIKRATESINCGGGDSQSESFRAHDTIAQCPIGPVGEGGGMRVYDGFWLTLPSINVPVEGTLFTALSDEGTPVVRWTVGSLAGIDGFNVYRATLEEGPFERLNESLLEPRSPGSYTDVGAWPQTTFWYEVRAVHADGSEEALAGSPVDATTEGRLTLRLFPIWPNPATGSASIRFDIPDHSGAVQLVIYNVSGQRVSTIADGLIERGRYTRTWDCRDDSGQPLASGVYFARLAVDGRTDSAKAMVLR